VERRPPPDPTVVKARDSAKHLKARLAAERDVAPQQCKYKYVDGSGDRCPEFTKVQRKPHQGWMRSDFCFRHGALGTRSPEERRRIGGVGGTANAAKWKGDPDYMAQRKEIVRRATRPAAWLGAFRWYLEEHPDDERVKALEPQLARALADPGRPVVNLVRSLDEDPQLRRVLGGWRLRHGRRRARGDARYNQSVGQSYAIVRTRRQLPRLAHLLAAPHEGRPVSLHLPEWVKSHSDFAVLCAAADELRREGVPQAEIARRFRLSGPRGPRMAGALLDLAEILSHKSARRDWYIADRWRRAVAIAKAGAYSRS
jgi:hypothetical protein